MWKNSIKAKLVVSFALVTLVAVTVAGASALISVRKTTEQEIQNNLLFLADAKEGQIFTYLDFLESRTIDFSSDGFIRDKLKEIIGAGSPAAVESLNEYLIKNKKPLDENIFRIIILDSAGKVIASTKEKEIGGDESAAEQFIEGQKGVFISGENFLSVAAPITDRETGKFLGVIVNNFTADKLNDILSMEFESKKGVISSGFWQVETLAIYLVNKEKKIFAHGCKKTKCEIDAVGTFPVQQCFNNKEEFAGEYLNNFGENVIGVSICFPQRGWVLLAEVNVNEALAPARDTTYGLVLMLTLVLIFVIFIIYLISGNIAKPIKELHKALDIIAQGNLEYKVDIRTRDEIEQLSHAFNQMTVNLKYSRDELRQYSEGLEEKVAEKTKDLQNKVEDLKEAQKAILNVAEDLEREKQKTAKERDKIDAILHSIGDGVFVVDKDLKVILVNKVAADMAGYKMEEILGAKYTEKLKFVFEGTEKINDQLISKAIETKTIQEISNHTVLVDKAGNKIPVADSAAPLFDAGFNVIGCVVVFRDVTKERNIEKTKNDFLSLASHQLRTPLSGTKWLINTIQRGVLGKMNKKQSEYLGQIYNINERMIKLVSDMLNVLRLESDAVIIEKETISISKLYDELVLMMESAAKSKGVILKNIPKGHKEVFIETDAQILRSILENFISNSINYSSSGQVVILDAKDEAAAIVFFVKDHGIGIPKKEQEQILKRFYRASNAKEFKPDGTGLGLYTALILAEKIGAKIFFESKEGKGSIFYLRVPKKVEKNI